MDGQNNGLARRKKDKKCQKAKGRRRQSMDSQNDGLARRKKDKKCQIAKGKVSLVHGWSEHWTGSTKKAAYGFLN